MPNTIPTDKTEHFKQWNCSRHQNRIAYSVKNELRPSRHLGRKNMLAQTSQQNVDKSSQSPSKMRYPVPPVPLDQTSCPNYSLHFTGKLLGPVPHLLDELKSSAILFIPYSTNISHYMYKYVMYVWCVCMDVWMDGCMDGWMHLCIHVSMYLCIYVSMYLCIYVWMYVWMYRCIDVWMYGYMHACMHACMYVYTFVCVYVYTLIELCFQSYGCIPSVSDYIPSIMNFKCQKRIGISYPYHFAPEK